MSADLTDIIDPALEQKIRHRIARSERDHLHTLVTTTSDEFLAGMEYVITRIARGDQ